MSVVLRPAKDTIAQMFSRRFFKIASLTGLALIVFAFAFPIWQLFPDIRERIAIPLHYNIHFGVDLFGPWWLIFTFPAVGLIILILNFVMAFFLWRREKVLSYFFVSVSIITSLVALTSTIFVVLLNLTYD